MLSDDLRYELDEALAEIERHHMDFQAISVVVHEALDRAAYCSEHVSIANIYHEALIAIRKVVG